MEVNTLNSANYIGLSAAYSYDNQFVFDQNVYCTEQGINLPLSPVLAAANDNAINNYSNLFLTQSVPLVSAAYIQDLERIPDDGFTTYLIANAIEGVESTSSCLLVQEPPFTVATAAISMSGSYASIDNRYFFTIKFHTDSLCKVEHVNSNTVRYLTMGADQSLYFTFDTGTDYLNELSPQLFYYLYDRVEGYIILSKNLQDIPHYLCLTTPTPALSSATLSAIPAVSGVPSYPTTAILKCIDRPAEPNNTLLFDPWVSYQQDFLSNTQNINPDKSVANINSNLLLHSQYSTVTGNSLDINALSLKNTNTPENYQSRNNPFQSNKSQFLTEDDISLREYKALFTGSNQVLGNDNITLGYESYTTDIILKADKVTYFHVPQLLYPFTRINVNDSGLIQAGAIAGDHPIKADKIFKKQASAKYYSPFGTVSDETNGSFLCSWLSGSNDVESLPIWVDRYYNPSKISFSAALTARSLKAITYSTVFEGYADAAVSNVATDEVFDVPSNLTFEPGVYYAYYHYGHTGVSNYIKILTPYVVEQGFLNYLNVDGSSAITDQTQDSEYIFDGANYAITGSLSSIQDSNQFTLCFDMYNSDWSKPFGYQILGNFNNDGVGVYNKNFVTPTLVFKTAAGVDIFNTDFTKIKSVTYDSPASRVIRRNFGENYTTIGIDGSVTQYTCDDTPVIRDVSNKSIFARAEDIINTDDTAYVLYSTGTNNVLSGVANINLITNAISAFTDNNIQQNCIFATSPLSTTTRPWSAIAASSNGMYQTAIAGTNASNSYIYRSTDYGLTWAQSIATAAAPRASIAMSSDGRYQAVIASLYLYQSIDYGVTWATTSPGFSGTAIAMSSDGKYQTIVVSGGYIYRSSNYGITWTQATSDITRAWSVVAMSSDGKYQTAAVFGGSIYRSTDYGVTWIVVSGTTGTNWFSMAMSSDGKYQIAASSTTSIRRSIDYGVTWLTVSTVIRSWRGLAMSSDGKYQTAVADNNYIYRSSNYGGLGSWVQITNDATRAWRGVTLSSDGKYQTAVADNNYIYRSTDYGATWGPFTSETQHSNISYYNNKLYITPSIVARRIDNDLYYLTNDGTTINAWYDIDTNTTSPVQILTAFKSTQQIKDFNIDYSGNLWILTSKNYYKYTQNKEFLLSGTNTSNTQITQTITLTGNGTTTSFNITNSGSAISSDYTVILNNTTTLRPVFDYTITNNTQTLTLYTPPASGSTISVSRTYLTDVYNNEKIDFITEFIKDQNIDRVVIARTGYGSISADAVGYQFDVLSLYGQPLSSTFYDTLPYGPDRQDLTNSDYNREYLLDAYPDSNLNVKVVTKNILNSLDVKTTELIYNLSALDPGYHHFAIRFDAYHGYMSLFINGQKVGNTQFEPRKYKFSNLIYRPFLIGTACFNNSIPLFKYLKKDSYLVGNTKIKNFYLYDTPLFDCDIMMHARLNSDIQDIHFDVPCGRRNYLEEIERYFRATLPGSKSTKYNVILRNTGITDPALQAQVEARLAKTIINSAPAYAKLNKIKWSN